ncbi:hypothetical protein BP5796_07280 [Coleophoma crateriformis]|uniref:Uncharacterized protein n=1 Tax=Coleophoma crateriformis TaxID=565419 RepID=A0A3D8RIT4_9HELO|nr:hypothetical protein BP5796_07280 [Coleophoma crateriformis]
MAHSGGTTRGGRSLSGCFDGDAVQKACLKIRRETYEVKQRQKAEPGSVGQGVRWKSRGPSPAVYGVASSYWTPQAGMELGDPGARMCHGTIAWAPADTQMNTDICAGPVEGLRRVRDTKVLSRRKVVCRPDGKPHEG